METTYVRAFIYRAYERGMTFPEYVFISCMYLIKDGDLTPWIDPTAEPLAPEVIEMRQLPFMGVKLVSSVVQSVKLEDDRYMKK